MLTCGKDLFNLDRSSQSSIPVEINEKLGFDQSSTESPSHHCQEDTDHSSQSTDYRQPNFTNDADYWSRPGPRWSPYSPTISNEGPAKNLEGTFDQPPHNLFDTNWNQQV